MAQVSLRLPRPLHPLAWWIWSLGMATAASRTTNPLLLALILAAVTCVVVARRSSMPWARSFRAYFFAGALIIVIRVAFATLLLTATAGHLLFTLPEVTLPGWAVGLRLGGPVYLESILAAFCDGLRLATLLICIGAANTLANPKRLMRCVPAALYEIGTTIVVAMSVAPQLVEAIARVRRTRRLRGSTDRGWRAVRGIVIPVLADSLDRSLALAAAMDSRGYGRTGDLPKGRQRVSSVMVIAGLIGVAVGVYALLDPGTSRLIGLPLLMLGLTASVCGFVVAGRMVRRTSYRPDPWGVSEWLVAASGILAAALMYLSGSVDPENLNPSLVPLVFPSVSGVALVAILIGAAPAWIAPPVSATVRRPSAGGARPGVAEPPASGVPTPTRAQS